MPSRLAANPIKALIWLGIGLVGLTLLAAGFVYALAKDSAVGYKILPASDEWFRSVVDRTYPPAPPPIPDDQNLYVELVRIGQSVPHSRLSRTQQRRFSEDPELRDSAHKAWVESFLERTKDAGAALRAASKQFSQYRFNDEEEENGKDLRAVEWAFYVLELDSQLELANGHKESALADIFATLRLANTITRGSPTALDHYTAADAAREARATLVNIIPKLTREETKQALDLIPPSPARDEELQRALQYGSRVTLEYLHREKTLDWLRSYGKADPLILLDEQRSGTLDEEQTVNGWIRLMDVYMANCGRPWSALDKSSEAAIHKLREELPKRPGFTHLSSVSEDLYEAAEYRKKMNKLPNSRGKVFLSNYADYSWSVSHSFYRRTGANSTRTRLATRLYAFDHLGQFPASLSDLVKEGYMEAVPLDLFSGRAFRFDPKRRVIWSTGPDGIDNGGRENKADPSQQGSDWVYRL